MADQGPKAQIGPEFDPPTELKWTQLESTHAAWFASQCTRLPPPHSCHLPHRTKAFASSQVNPVLPEDHESMNTEVLKVYAHRHSSISVYDLISSRAQANVNLDGGLSNENSIKSIFQCRTVTK